jgi:hypothetical protein
MSEARTSRAGRALGLAVVLGGLLAACQLVGGISERRIDDGTPGAGGNGVGGTGETGGTAGAGGAGGNAGDSSDDAALEAGAGAAGALDAGVSHVHSRRFGDDFTQSVEAMSVFEASGHVALLGEFRGELDFGGRAAKLEADTDADVFLARFDAAGAAEWALPIRTAAYSSIFATTAIDREGAILIGGFAMGSIRLDATRVIEADGFGDIFFARYEADGKLTLVRSYSEAREQQISALATRGDSIFVVGGFVGEIDFGGGASAPYDQSFRGFVAALDPNGIGSWLVPAAGCLLTSVEPLPDGGVLVGGSLSGSCTLGGHELMTAELESCFLARLSALGEVGWTVKVDEGSSCSVADIALADNGQIVVMGSGLGLTHALASASSVDPDLFVAKLDGSSKQLWGTLLERPGIDSGKSVVLDTAGRVLVSGHVPSGVLVTALSLDSGVRLFTRETYSPTPFVEPGVFLGVDDSGAWLVAGTLNASVNLGGGALEPAGGPGQPDVFLAKFAK